MRLCLCNATPHIALSHTQSFAACRALASLLTTLRFTLGIITPVCEQLLKESTECGRAVFTSIYKRFSVSFGELPFPPPFEPSFAFDPLAVFIFSSKNKKIKQISQHMLNDDVSRQTFTLVLQLILAKINFYSVFCCCCLLVPRVVEQSHYLYRVTNQGEMPHCVFKNNRTGSKSPSF